MHATVLGITFMAAMYAVALFGFRMFELIPVARWTLIEQMPEGVLVLDPRARVVDVNPSAQRILGLPAERARGRLAQRGPAVLPGHERLARALGGRSVGDQAR